MAETDPILLTPKVVSLEELAAGLGMSVEEMLAISKAVAQSGAAFFRSSDGTESFLGGTPKKVDPAPEG
jgi:hypothetical protein